VNLSVVGFSFAVLHQHHQKYSSIMHLSKAAITLWGFSGSSTTNRIRIALAVKGIPYEMHTVDLSQDEPRSEEYKSTKNRMAQIPLLEINNGTNPTVTLAQAVAILEYLEEAYPDTLKLLPNDPIQRAQVREVVEIINSFIQPLQNKLIVETVARTNEQLAAALPIIFATHLDGTKCEASSDASRLMWPQKWIHMGFTAIEHILTSGNNEVPRGKYCFGDFITLADCSLIPQVIGAKKYQVNLARFPRICKVYNNVIALDSVKEQLSDVLTTLDE
jgi:maleylacetoacetate isomerase